MSGFPRDLEAALNRRYDLIIVGGGIYGMTLTLEAARRGLRPLLLERDDFGGATSLNSLRILHGGLRYLQTLDIPRFFESVGQRSWFMSNFSPLCRVLPCLMPLYCEKLRHPAVFRVALTLNDALARDAKFPGGRVLGVRETIERFPATRRDGLKGGALWYDGQILCPQRLHAELLRWATACGATVLNYVEVLGLQRNGSSVAGVATNVGTFFAPVIINAAGPWSREVAQRLDADRPGLLTPSLAFNILIDLPPPSDAAVAVQGLRTYFIAPHRNGSAFAGTVHRAWEGVSKPTEAMIGEFVEELNEAIPDWGLDRSKVVRVTAGVLPAIGPGKPDMAHRSTFIKHEIGGLFSACGIKYTTAPSFARRAINRVFGPAKILNRRPWDIGDRSLLADPGAVMTLADDALERLAQEEAVTSVEDFTERRMDWILDETERARFNVRLAHILRQPHANYSGEVEFHSRSGA